MTEWQRSRTEQDRRYLLRKTLDAAENRMRTRTAKQQLADAMAEKYESREFPDADDSGTWERGY